MNYRHGFHAGNFADLVKHALLLKLLDAIQAEAPALEVIDTHAGAGVYDLTGEAARRTGEAEAGISRLMAAADAPAAFAPLVAAVARLNEGGPPRLYPGSPRLAAERLRPADRLTACEARADDHELLRRALSPYPQCEAVRTDGWSHGAAIARRASGARFVLIDPPYEAADDGVRAAALTAEVLRADPAARLAIWAPIKDMAGFERLVWDLEDAAGPASLLIAEARLRPLTDPMRMNGCAMILANPPRGIEPVAREIVEWVSTRLGEGGEGRVR